MGNFQGIQLTECRVVFIQLTRSLTLPLLIKQNPKGLAFYKTDKLDKTYTKCQVINNVTVDVEAFTNCDNTIIWLNTVLLDSYIIY